MNVLADTLRGTGEQHTNWNGKKASQEYLVNVLHLRNAWSALCSRKVTPSLGFFFLVLSRPRVIVASMTFAS